MARITKAEKLRRVNQIRVILSRGGTRSECHELAATEWGLKPRSADFYIHEANQEIVQDFEIDRKEYTAQLLQVIASRHGEGHGDQPDGRSYSSRGTGHEAGSIGPLSSVIFFHPHPPRKSLSKTHQSGYSGMTAAKPPKTG